jgi:hypothetical protein
LCTEIRSLSGFLKMTTPKSQTGRPVSLIGLG